MIKIKNYILIYTILFSVSLWGQKKAVVQLNEGYTYNDLSSNQRELRFHPNGNGVEVVNGNRKFIRGLYGANSGFRMECSDMPEFGLYLPRMGGNLKINTSYKNCTTRYEAGKMIYTLDNGLVIEAQVMRNGVDAALWKIKNNSNHSQKVDIHFGGVADVKFYREGDLGVDKPDCFDFKETYCKDNDYTVHGNEVEIDYGRKTRSKLFMTLPSNQIEITQYPSLKNTFEIAPNGVEYIAIYPLSNQLNMSINQLPAHFMSAEKYRNELAQALYIRTPDDFITPIGEALALAADGIWSGEVWLHGAIGWRAPYSGWRGAYVGDALGWHDRARKHFNVYAENQIKDIPAIKPHPYQDSTLNMARAAKVWGTQMYSDGYICRRPGQKSEMSHYDMNLCYIDELLRHLSWTGDKDYARQIFPIIDRHLKWEKRNFDPNNDALYDAYCCIWASDALYYNSGAVTHSTAYNYYANKKTAEIAELIGIDPTPYKEEAESILKALNDILWLKDKGHWAEFKDYMGKQRTHPNAALWTIYHAIDSEVATPFQAYSATRYVDNQLPHIPVEANGIENGKYAVISTTSWKPYSWSINNVAIAEVMHMALAYWQSGRKEKAFNLMKSVALDNMYLGASPLNFGQISFYDATRGECYRDFGDPIGVWSRAMIEGLYGIKPDAMNGKVLINPGFPKEWDNAELSMKDIAYQFKRSDKKIEYQIEQRFNTALNITLQIDVNANVKRVRVNGKTVTWSAVEDAIELPQISINLGSEKLYKVDIEMGKSLKAQSTGRIIKEGPITFYECKDNKLVWWQVDEQPLNITWSVDNGFKNIESESIEMVNLSSYYNSSVSDIFNNDYVSPRSPYTTLQIPTQGIGEWCHPKHTATIDDSGLRTLLTDNEVLNTNLGVNFRSKKYGNNIIYTSLWDNYPDQVEIPLSGTAQNIYLLMAGSTNHMQYGVDNGIIKINYTDGSSDTLSLVNPTTWVPIEQDIFYNEGAFAPESNHNPPYRIHFKDGKVSRYLGEELSIEGVYGREIECGAGIILDMKTNPKKELKSLNLETCSNDVVIGLMGISIQR